MAVGAEVEWTAADRMTIDGVRYVLMADVAEPDELRLFKPRVFVEAYERVVDELHDVNVVELGIYAGGSTAYFAQRCAPRRLIALDRSPGRVEQLDRFVADRGLSDRVELHYGVDQSDRDRLRSIVDAGFGGDAIDLVIDDASHAYGPTVASFEALFPLVRPGGSYLIEDWAADDWLALTFADRLSTRDPQQRSATEAWVATLLADPDGVAGRVFERWILTALGDPGAAHHEVARRWCTELERPDATDAARTIHERVRARSASGGAELAGPTLGRLGAQLLLAVKHLCPAIAEVSVTPWWIAVRRGGPVDPDTFRVETFAGDLAAELS